MRPVAIVGRGGSKDATPTEGWDIWGLPWSDLPAMDLGIELHHREDWPNYTNGNYPDRLCSLGSGLLLRQPMRDFPEAGVYPRQEVLNLVGQYLACSISWLIALAVLQGRERIGVFGADFWEPTIERLIQRPSVEYTIGFARGRGAVVTIPESSPLMRCKLYC